MIDYRDKLLKVYELETETEIGPGERLFRIVALLSCALFGAVGLYLRTHNPPERVMEERAARSRQVSFLIEERKKPKLSEVTARQARPQPQPAKPQEKKPAPVPEKPIDLTKKPLLNQKMEEPKPDNSPAKTNETVRPVYGLHKVYNTGLGEGGAAADAVVGKLGNTLAADIDTFKATNKELKGVVAPASRVQKFPVRKNEVKPEYTQEMAENSVEGVIRANILVDVDGTVQQVVVLNDLGFGTKKAVYDACLKLRYEPALLDGKPVAVWYSISFRFEMTE